MRVLVVDADWDLREMVADLLLDSKVEVLGAASADEALLLLRGEPVDVVLCHLPILRARDRRLRRRLASLPTSPRVVAMSASGIRATGEEADASLAKPFTRSQLLAALRLRYSGSDPR
jgi:DNA-binding response OmpR family regulator